MTLHTIFSLVWAHAILTLSICAYDTHHSNVEPPPLRDHGECWETPPIPTTTTTLSVVYLKTTPTSCPSSPLCVEAHITSPWGYRRGLFVAYSHGRNVLVSTWDTSGSWWMWAWHVTSYEGGILILCWNREPSTVIPSCMLMSGEPCGGLWTEARENLLIQVCLFLARGNHHKQMQGSHPSSMNEKIIHTP